MDEKKTRQRSGSKTPDHEMQLSYPEEECTKYKLKFWNIPEIRQMDIQKQLQEGTQVLRRQNN